MIENRISTVNTLYAVSKKQAYERLSALTNLPLPPKTGFLAAMKFVLLVSLRRLGTGVGGPRGLGLPPGFEEAARLLRD